MNLYHWKWNFQNFTAYKFDTCSLEFYTLLFNYTQYHGPRVLYILWLFPVKEWYLIPQLAAEVFLPSNSCSDKDRR